jgi:hypothetical protein
VRLYSQQNSEKSSGSKKEKCAREKKVAPNRILPRPAMHLHAKLCTRACKMVSRESRKKKMRQREKAPNRILPRHAMHLHAKWCTRTCKIEKKNSVV